MKYVEITPEVVLTNPLTGKRLQWREEEGSPLVDHPAITPVFFLRQNVFGSPFMGKGIDAVVRVLRVEKAFSTEVQRVVNGKHYAAIEDDDYKHVMDALNDAPWNNNQIAAQQYAFMGAWRNALNELPTEAPKPEVLAS